MSRHVNNGSCEKCIELKDLYPGFHAELWNWFAAFQKKNPDGHISCAGRGKEAQEAAFAAKTSKARYGESSHNYNAALDIFRLTTAGASFDKVWYRDKVGTAVFSNNSNPEKHININWYGKPGAVFQESPHVEVDGWSDLARHGELKLVENIKEPK